MRILDPDPPRFSVIPKTSTSFAISWHPNNGTVWGLSGATFHLRYGILGSSEYNQTEEVALPVRNFVLDNLRPDSDYYIVGVARENNRYSESPQYKLHTSSGLNLSHLNAANLREAAWFIVILVVLGITLLILTVCCCCAHYRSGKYPVKQREKKFGKADNDQDEYKKFMEYHQLNEKDDPPTISVSLAADSTIDSRRRAMSLEGSQKSHHESEQLIPHRNS